MKQIRFIIFFVVLSIAAYVMYFRQTPKTETTITVAAVHDKAHEKSYGNSIYSVSIDSSELLTDIQNIGVYNNTGRITSLVIDATDSNHLIAGGDWGGLWVSHNRGTSWSPVNDFAHTLRVASLDQNKFRHNEYYYTTGVNRYVNNVLQNDLYKSVDGGQHFFPLTPATIPAIGIIDKLLCSPVDPNTVYFMQRFGANNSFGAIYRTTDNFASFQKVFFIHGVIPRDFILLPDGGVVVTSDNKVWNSQTGDPGSFVLSNTGIPSSVFNLHVAVCESQPDIRYAAGNFLNNRIAVFKSTNAGSSWNFLDTLVISTNAGRNIIAVNPDNPDIVFVAGVNFRGSSDGGLNWKSATPGWDFFQFIFDKHQPNMVFFASDNGVQSLNLANMTTFTFGAAKKYNNTLVVQDIVHGDHSINGNMNIAGLMDISTHLTRNDQVSSRLYSADGMYAYCSKTDSNLAYFSIQGGVMHRLTSATINLGFSRILNQLDVNNDGSIDEGAAFYNPYVMNDADHNQLYIPTLKRLWRSTDKGSNWAPVSGFYGNTTYRLSITASNKPNPIVYWTNMDSVFVLPNAATAAPLSEFAMPVPVDPERIQVDPNNDSALFLMKKGFPSQILYAPNMFSPIVQWVDFGANFPATVTPLCITSYPGNSQVMLVGAYEGGIYITLDGGQTWTKEKHFPNVRISEMKFRDSDKKLFIYTYGRGVWAAKLPIQVVPLTLLSFQAAPNVAQKSATLTWKTAAELNTGSFQIEMSEDANRFSYISSVNAMGQGSNSYSATIPMQGQLAYFRLKIIDRDGSYLFSDIRKVKLPVNREGFAILVNPVREGILELEVYDRQLAGSAASITDNLGRMVKRFTITIGRQSVDINHLASGTYYIKTNAGTRKVVVGR